MEGSDALDALATAVDPAMVVVTTTASGERAGCLVGFHGQCSIDPVRHVVWLSKANHTCRVGLRADYFAVHFLDRAQRDLAVRFGTVSGDDTDKFEADSWTAGPGGVPLLDACPHRLVGRKVAMVDEGSDHVTVYLEPVAAQTDGALTPLRLADVADLDPGHEAEERPSPPTERAG